MNRKWLSIMLAAALSVALIMAACSGSPPPTQPAQVGQPPSGAAGDSAPTQTASSGRSLTIVSVDGVVEVKAAGHSDLREAEEGQVLNPGDEIRTGPNGKAVLVLDDGTQMVLSPNSSFALSELGGTPDDPISRFFLNAGSLFAVHTGELSTDAKFEIETPAGVAAIRGTYLGVVYFPGSKKGTVMCLTGKCSFAPPGGPVQMSGNQALRFNEEGVDSGLFELTIIHLELWADVLDLLESASFGDKGTVVECACDGTSLACDDGSVYAEFPSCMPVTQEDNAVCWCEGTSMVCEDGSIYPDDGTCAGGNEDYCVCDGTTSYCLDGSVFEDDPACSPDNACYCEGADLACSGKVSYSDPVCSVYAFACLDAVCGDDYCDSLCGEFNETCPDDCPIIVVDCSEARCGDNVCDLECGESETSCSVDCGSACDTAVCGDGVCDGTCGEDSASCSDDCVDACAEATCGNGVCDASCGEDASWCADCGEQDPCAGVTCGDNSCDSTCGEDPTTCSFDCGQPEPCEVASCGDGTCDSSCGEDPSWCGDCSVGGGDPCADVECGDGICSSACGEDSDICSVDCGALIVLPFPDRIVEPEPVCRAIEL